jgi:predicted Ser/Thr protein kinase
MTTATDAHLAQLSDDRRRVLESWLVDFDLSWDEGRLAFWVHRLPPRDSCLRWPALVEMVKIDLERRWQRGQHPNLEAYVKAFPELGPPDRLPVDLLLAEYEARQQCGAPADLAEFARRFPRQAEELRRLVGQTRDEAAIATSRSSLETVKPPDHAPDARGGAAAPGLPAGRAAGAVTPDVPLPERLGRYRILRELGRGAMGTVYLAHDCQLERPVALKVPQFTAADGPEVRQRFLSEARAAATIQHPNVCPVYDVGEIDGTPYLTMAYLQGQSLAQLVNGGALPQQQAAAIVRQLTVALHAAHERGIIHRDLKPSNIIINQQGEPVILDFGLARRLRQDGVRLTQYGQPLGTPAYMSPEQVIGAIQVMGPGCDIYALGVILYQLLTGRLPFEGSVTEVLCQIVVQQPVPPSKLRPGLDPRLEAICLKALSKGIADRHPSMRDLGAALADYLRSDPPPAAIPTQQHVAVPTPAASEGARPRTAWLGCQPLFLLLIACGLAVAGGAAVVLVVGAILWNNSSRGTIQLDLEGTRGEVEVQVDGERIDSATLNEPLRLRPGKHHLLVAGKQIQTVSTSFNVVSGANPALRVQLVPRTDGAVNSAPPPSTVAPAPEPAKKPVTPPDQKKKKKRHNDDDWDDD